MGQNESRRRLQRLVQLALLIALLLVLSFTPLGYLHLGIAEITLLAVPVAIGANRLGPSGGALLGAVFGLTSFAQCFGTSTFGVTLLSIQPVFTAVMCIVPRILCGWLAGLAFRLLARRGHTGLPVQMGAALCCSLGNTVLFTGTFLLLFGRSDYVLGLRAGKGLLLFAAGFIGVQGLIEAAVCCLMGGAISFALQKALKRME